MTIGGADLLSLVDKGGVVAALAMVVIAVIRGWLVPGHSYRDLMEDRDFWRQAALTTTNAAEKAVSIASSRQFLRGRGEDAG